MFALIDENGELGYSVSTADQGGSVFMVGDDGVSLMQSLSATAAIEAPQ